MQGAFETLEEIRNMYMENCNTLSFHVHKILIDPSSITSQGNHLGKSLTISSLSFLICEVGMMLITYVLGLFWGLSDVIHVKPVERGLAQRKCSVSVSYYFDIITARDLGTARI